MADPLSGGGAFSSLSARCSKKVKERADIAADGHPAGTPGTGGVERLLPRENGQRLVGGEREEEELFDLSAGIAWFGDIIKMAWFKNARFRVTHGISARTLIGPALERVYATPG